MLNLFLILHCFCCPVPESDNKLLYIVITSLLTVLGSIIITKYSNRLTDKTNFEVVKSDIISSCHKLLRSITGMQTCKLNMKTSERLMNLEREDQVIKFHKEQTIIFQNYHNDLSISFEEYRSDLQKFLRLYFVHCSRDDKKYVMIRKRIIDGNLNLKNFEEYDTIEEKDKIKEKEKADKAETPELVNCSDIGIALNEIMNYLSKEFV